MNKTKHQRLMVALFLLMGATAHAGSVDVTPAQGVGDVVITSRPEGERAERTGAKSVEKDRPSGEIRHRWGMGYESRMRQRQERVGRPAMERPERPERHEIERPEHPVRPAMPERPSRPERPDRHGRH